MSATRPSTRRRSDVVGRLIRSIRDGAWVALCVVAAAPCFAAVEIQIDGATEVLEKNIREFLSLTRYAEREDLNEETLTRLARRIPSEVRRALEPLGYYDAAATYSTARSEDRWVVNIAVEPGRAVRISTSTVEIVGAGRDEAALRDIVRRGDLHPGARLDHGVYEAVKAELLRTATAIGYLDARLTRNEMIVDPAERRAQIYLSLDSGERYRFGPIDIQQPVVHDSVARRLLRMQSGDPYSLDAVLQSQYFFDNSQYFVNTEFEPGEPDRERHEVPLSVRADRNKRNRYAIGGGYGTDTSVRGKLAWDTRYLNRSGHRSLVELTGSSVLSEGRATYIVPVRDVALEKVQADGGVAREELGDILSKRYDIGFGLTQVLSDWQRVLFVRLQRENSEPIGTSVESDSVPTGEKFYIFPGIRFETLPPHLLERTSRNFGMYAELTGSPETLGSDATFLRLFTSAERVFRFAPHWSARLRGQLGVTWSDDFDSVPVSHRFFAGGDNSVRGFGLNELSPLDPVTGQRVGGRYLALASAEVERDIPNPWLGNDLGGAVFADAGNAFEDTHDPIEYSVGVGLRYRLVGVASIGVDVAQALSQNRSPRFHLRITTLL